MKIIYLISSILLLFTELQAEQQILLNNEEIQEYKGKLGKWILIDSRKNLIAFAKKNSINIDEIYNLNSIGNYFIKNYYFIPYTEENLKDLEKRNITRNIVISNEEEFIWPVEEVIKVSSGLGFRNRKFHTGVDLPVIGGKPILAAMEGMIIYNGYADGYGNIIIIEHRNNYTTKYAHNYKNLVKKDDFVKKGQIIGLVGSSGISTGNHLHFEIRCKDIPLDPLNFLPQKNDLSIIHTLKNWK